MKYITLNMMKIVNYTISVILLQLNNLKSTYEIQYLNLFNRSVLMYV